MCHCFPVDVVQLMQELPRFPVSQSSLNLVTFTVEVRDAACLRPLDHASDTRERQTRLPVNYLLNCLAHYSWVDHSFKILWVQEVVLTDTPLHFILSRQRLLDRKCFRVEESSRILVNNEHRIADTDLVGRETVAAS